METQFIEETKQCWYVRTNFNVYSFDCIEQAKSFAKYWNVEFN